MQTQPVTPAQRMAAFVPKWTTEALQDPVSMVRRATVPPRRPAPVNVNHPRVPQTNPGSGGLAEFESVGAGQKVFIESEDGGPNKIKSVKSIGEGTAVLAEESPTEIRIKTLKPGDDSPLQVVDDGEQVEIKGNGYDQTIRINSGGTIVIKDGLIESASEGLLGGTGSMATVPCPDTEGNSQPSIILSWVDGQIITDPGEEAIELNLGECQTQSPGA